MLSREQIETFLKQASIPEDAREIFSEILEGYLETLELCEKQADDLTAKAAEIQSIRSESAVKLQKVASTETLKKTAQSIADTLIEHQMMLETSKPALVSAVVDNPEKMASIVENIFNALVPVSNEGSGIESGRLSKKEASDKNLIPADDPFMDVIRNGA